MRFWIGPAGTPAKSSIEGIRQISKLGLNAMEIEFVYGVRMSTATAREIGKVAKQHNVRLTVHAPYYINLLSQRPAVRAASQARILAALSRAHAMRAYAVTFHAGFYSGRTEHEAFKMVKAACSRLLAKKAELGYSPKLALETAGKLSAFGTLEQILKLRKYLPIIPCVDFAHIYARNQGKIDFDKILTKLKHIDPIYAHFSCISFGARGERRHMLLSYRKPDYRLLAAALRKRKQSAILICESPSPLNDALKMKKLLL